MSRRILALLLIAGWMTTAAAVPVSVRFTGTILSTDPSGPFAGISGSFSGGITYDTVGTDDYPPAGVGGYTFTGSPYGYFVNLPGSSIVAPGAGVNVYDDGGGFYPSDTVELTTKYEAVGYIATLRGPNGSFAGEAIPDASILPSFWHTGTFTIRGPSFETWLTGSIDSVTVVALPASDFDGDGRSDLLWRNSATGENYLYPMNGTAILPSEGYIRTVANQAWQVAGTGDFDGDGRADILWRNFSTGENYLYLMEGTTIAGEGYLRTVADQNWQVAGVGDFNGDGRADILWRNASTGENYIYLMNGTVITGEGFIRTVADQAWQVVGVGDFDGDGKADILWRNLSSGANYIYLMNALVILASEGYFRTVANLDWNVAGVGDLDGDGRSDIVWRNSATGENYLYPMIGLAIKASEGYLRSVADQNWQIMAIADYDGDGTSDLFWRNSATGENYLFPMDGRAIRAGEGYVRTVAQANWRVVGPVPAPTVYLPFRGVTAR
jgi:hypothetical protein